MRRPFLCHFLLYLAKKSKMVKNLKVSLTILVMGLFCIKTASTMSESEVEHGAMSTLQLCVIQLITVVEKNFYKPKN